MKHMNRARLFFLPCIVGGLLLTSQGKAQNCVTQSQMPPADRDTLASTSESLALKVLANDQAGLKSATIPEFQSNFSGIGSAVTAAYQKMTGSHPEVEQVYILDASETKKNDDGSAPDTEFICSLTTSSKQSAEADFSIRSLPPGRYAFSMVDFVGGSPYRLSMLLRQDGTDAPWKLAGLFIKQTVAAGHDGLWYWTQGRSMATNKQPWTSYVYFRQAQQLLQPADFVSSSHLEKLREEASSAAPPEITNGIGPDAPLVVKGSDGSDYQIIAVGPDSGLPNDKLDIALHRLADPATTDPLAVQKRNRDAMSAFLALHPELRESFHGIWVFADAADRPSIATEAAMNDIH